MGYLLASYNVSSMFAGSGDAEGRAEKTSPALPGKPQTQGPDEGLSRVEGDRRIGVMPKGCGVSFWSNGNFLKLGVVMAAHFCGYSRNH